MQTITQAQLAKSISTDCKVVRDINQAAKDGAAVMMHLRQGELTDVRQIKNIYAMPNYDNRDAQLLEFGYAAGGGGRLDLSIIEQITIG